MSTKGGINDAIPMVAAVRLENEADIYVDPNTVASTPPPIMTPIVAAAAAPTTPSAVYYKNPTQEMIEQSKHAPKTNVGILFIQTSGVRGKFTLGKNVNAAHIMSGDDIDLSMADFIHPVTTITVSAVMGGIDVVVPRGVRVQANGLGILGGFDGIKKKDRHLAEGEDGPLVVVKGVAIMGGVDVKVNKNVPPIRIVY